MGCATIERDVAMDEPRKPRRPGRPPLSDDGPTKPVCFALSCEKYDRLYARARRERITVPELIRRALVRRDTSE